MHLLPAGVHLLPAGVHLLTVGVHLLPAGVHLLHDLPELADSGLVAHPGPARPGVAVVKAQGPGTVTLYPCSE